MWELQRGAEATMQNARQYFWPISDCSHVGPTRMVESLTKLKRFWRCQGELMSDSFKLDERSVTCKYALRTRGCKSVHLKKFICPYRYIKPYIWLLASFSSSWSGLEVGNSITDYRSAMQEDWKRLMSLCEKASEKSNWLGLMLFLSYGR